MLDRFQNKWGSIEICAFQLCIYRSISKVWSINLVHFLITTWWDIIWMWALIRKLTVFGCGLVISDIYNKVDEATLHPIHWVLAREGKTRQNGGGSRLAHNIWIIPHGYCHPSSHSPTVPMYHQDTIIVRIQNTPSLKLYHKMYL